MIVAVSVVHSTLAGGGVPCGSFVLHAPNKSIPIKQIVRIVTIFFSLLRVSSCLRRKSGGKFLNSTERYSSGLTTDIVPYDAAKRQNS
jgi:hypothetical protein